jgi:hypothetical protein
MVRLSGSDPHGRKEGDHRRDMHCLRRLFRSHGEACLPGSFVFPAGPCRNRVPVFVSGMAAGGCGCPAGTWPETAFFCASHREKQIRSGRESAFEKNRFPDFTHMLCHACQSGKLIIFLYPSGSTGARGRSSANFGKTGELRSFYKLVWTGNGSLCLDTNLRCLPCVPTVACHTRLAGIPDHRSFRLPVLQASSLPDKCRVNDPSQPFCTNAS